MALSTREIAFLFWGLVFVAWALTEPGIRSAFLGVVRAALHWKLWVPASVVVLYSSLVLWGLYLIHFWTPALLKDTIVWVLFSGIALAFSTVAADQPVPSWRSILAGQLTAVVLVEYVVNTYTFRLWVELLLVPVMAVLVAIEAIAERDQQHRTVAKIARFLLGSIAFAVVSFAVWSAISAIGDFSVIETVRDVLLPVVLSLALLPLVFVFFLIFAYEELFLVLRLQTGKQPEVIRYAKWRLLRHLGLRPTIVRCFLRKERLALLSANTRADIDTLLKKDKSEPGSDRR